MLSFATTLPILSLTQIASQSPVNPHTPPNQHHRRHHSPAHARFLPAPSPPALAIHATAPSPLHTPISPKPARSAPSPPPSRRPPDSSPSAAAASSSARPRPKSSRSPPTYTPTA